MICIDYIILSIIIISSIISMIRGFIREILSLLTWYYAFFLTIQYYDYISRYFNYFQDKLIQDIITIILIFIVIFLLGTILKRLINSFINYLGMFYIDRICGIFFGMIRGIIIVALLIPFIMFDFFPILSHDWQNSQLILLLSNISQIIFKYYNSIIEDK